MTKRIITIILVLLAIFLLLVGGIWLLGRHTAQKNGSAPLSFRQFLGLSSKAPNATTDQGTLTSDFTDSTTGGNAGGNNPAGGIQGIGGSSGNGSPSGANGSGSIGAGGSGIGTNNVQTSQFTNDTMSPGSGSLGSGSVSSGGGSIISGNGGGTGSGSIGGGGSIGSGGVITSGGGFTTVGIGGTGTGNPGGGTGNVIGGTASCTAADTNISFTPDEIQQLNALQAQFNTLNSKLATSDQVAAELSTYNSYKLEEAKIGELQTFCQASKPLLTDPALKRHVPTPFWHDATQDSDTYTAGNVNSIVDGTNPSSGESFLERILRINLW